MTGPVSRPLPLTVVLLGLALLSGVAVVASVAIGSVAIPPGRVATVILDHVWPGGVGSGVDPTQDRIVWDFRLPRAALGFVVGAALSVAGAVLQAVLRNPLADPYISGVSAGASVGAVAVLTLGAGAVGLPVSLAAFLGALGATLAVYAFAQQGGRASPLRLVLAGVAVAYVLQAVTNVMVLRSSAAGGGGATSVLTWLAGSLGSASWSDLGLPVAITVAGTLGLTLAAGRLNAFLAGDETATSLGLDVGRARLLLFTVAALMVGVVVAVSGAIGFVGLIVPHAVRAFMGSDHRRVLPVSALAGGLLLVLVDLLARTVVAPTELPVGLLTAAVGGPVFLVLLRRSRALGASGGRG